MYLELCSLVLGAVTSLLRLVRCFMKVHAVSQINFVVVDKLERKELNNEGGERNGTSI